MIRRRRHTIGKSVLDCPSPGWLQLTVTWTKLDKSEMDEHTEFVKFLEKQALRYREILEGKFGPCDQKFVFGTIKKTPYEDDVPHTNFPDKFHTNGGCIVDIHISKWPWQHECRDQGTWQVAHESVHLLDPGPLVTTNNLEEGLATWFQDESKYHIDEVKRYIERGIQHSHNYLLAKELVRRCIPHLTSAVKEIRISGVRIRDITAQVLAPHLPNVDSRTIEQLCERFSY